MNTLDLAPAAVLARAADVIERNGHAVKKFYEGDGDTPARECRVCVLGAVAVACGLRPDAWAEEDMYGRELAPASAAADLLVMHLGLDMETSLIESVGAWNDDDDERTPTQVVEAMRAAARQAVASRG